MQANRARVAAKKAGVPLAQPAVVEPARQSGTAPKRGDQNAYVQGLRKQVRRWQLIGLAASGTAMLAIGLAAGMLLSR